MLISIVCFVWTEPSSATYKQVIRLIYTGTVITDPKTKAYKSEIENQLSVVQLTLQSQCDVNMGAKSPIVTLNQTVAFIVHGTEVGVMLVTSLVLFKIKQ